MFLFSSNVLQNQQSVFWHLLSRHFLNLWLKELTNGRNEINLDVFRERGASRTFEKKQCVCTVVRDTNTNKNVVRCAWYQTERWFPFVLISGTTATSKRVNAMFLFFVLSFEFHVGVLRLYGFVYHQTKRSNERGNCDTFHIELLFDIAKNSSNCFFNLHVKHCETDGNYTASVVYFHGTVPDIHHICSSSPAPPRTHTCQERLATCLNVECERFKKRNTWSWRVLPDGSEEESESK